MKEQLFKIKNELSEYVKQAEKGNVVEITKYGRTSAVIIGIDQYNELNTSGTNTFRKLFNEWKNEAPVSSSNEFPYDNLEA
ncbi:MAG: type II toxin-antitoxin system prevent-host-death family antitoxin [Treponema sp.]|nr:type II toxin-antitoxin system prevent-host-death family antitoxin [Treponema sp.]